MSGSLRQRVERERPLVAVVCSVPLLGEAMRSALDFAEVHTFAEDRGDVEGLLRSVRPDAVVVDSEDAAGAGASFAKEHGVPVLHVSVRDRALRVFRGGAWERVESDDGSTPEALRNAVAGAFFARVGAAR
ncbi:MAG TPA: hypothetical protein VJ986_06960, partial [Gaiellaceae bacterium]|nr:hypothetical protein [Gaiellaceae bacterium]